MENNEVVYEPRGKGNWSNQVADEVANRVYALAGYGNAEDETGHLTVVTGEVSDRYIGAKVENGVYSIKLAEGGIPYNPTEYNAIEEKHYQSFKGRSKYVFRPVKAEVFKQYLSFLRTKNTIFLEYIKRGQV